jgi:hypothetical protein
VDVSEIQEAVTDEFKKIKKEEFSAAFQKLYDLAKPVCMLIEFILNKKVMRLPLVSSILKNHCNTSGSLYICIYLFKYKHTYMHILSRVESASNSNE